MDPRYKDIGDPAVRLMEELAEAIQAVAKGIRFGWENKHPCKLRGPDDNLMQLNSEMDDILAAYGDFLRSLEGNYGK